MKKIVSINKRGFTLVELIVTLGIFAVVMLVGSNFLIQTIRNANTAGVQNEVRQNASVILQDIISRARRAYCVYYKSPSVAFPPYTNNALLRISDDPNSVQCTTGNTVEYYQDQNGVMTRAATDSGRNQLSFGVLTSLNTAILDCGSSGLACGLTVASSCTTGLVVSSTGGAMPIINGMPATLTIRAQQVPANVRSDLCAAVKLSDTITPRVK